MPERQIEFAGLRTIIVTLSLLAAWAMGLFFTGYRDVIYCPASLALMMAAGAALIPAFRQGLTFPRSAPVLLLFALFIYVTLSLTWSTVPFSSLITWIVFLSLPLSFFAFTLPANFDVAAAGRALMAGQAVLALWAIATFLHSGHAAASPLLDANCLAALLNLGLLPALSGALPHKDRKHAVLAAVLFAGVLATQSRGGFLCLAASFAVLCFVQRSEIRENRRFFVRLLAGGAVIFAIMQLIGHAPLAARLAALSTAEPNVASRLAIWKATLGLIAQHPWTGTGLGTFYLYYPSVRPPLIDNSSGFWAHNDPLQLWAETGVITPLLLYALILAVTISTAAALRKETSPEIRAGIAGLACALLSLALHMHIEFDLYLMPLLIVAGVWLAQWHRLTQGRAVAFTPAGWQRPFLSVSAAIVALIIGVCSLSSAVGQIHLLRAQDAIGRGNVTVFLSELDKAQRFAPGSFIDPAVQLAGFHIDMLAKPGSYFTSDDRRTMFESARALLDGAEKMNPVWSEIDRKRAKLYYAAAPDLMPDGKEQALTSWRAAIRKNRMNFRARQELAQALLARGEAEEAGIVLSAGLGYPHEQGVTEDFTALLRRVAPLARVQKLYRERKVAQ